MTAPSLPRYADWLTTTQVATKLGVPASLITTWILTGIKTEAGRVRLTAVKVGGHWRVEPATADAFIALPAVRDAAAGWKARCEARNAARAARRNQ